jgi:hypothetical protein
MQSSNLKVQNENVKCKKKVGHKGTEAQSMKTFRDLIIWQRSK